VSDPPPLAPVGNIRPKWLELATASLVGGLFAVLASQTSPNLALLLLAGIGVVACMAVFPVFGLLTMAALAPVERFGRLTDDTSGFTFSVMRVAGLLLVMVFFLHWVFMRRRFRFPSTLLWYAAYMTLGVMSLTWTSDLRYGLNQTTMQLGNLLFFFVVLNMVNNLKKARLLLSVWLIVVCGVGIFTIYKWHSDAGGIVDSEDYYLRGEGLTTEDRFAAVLYDPPSYEQRQRRAIGTTSHPGAYGINLLLALPVYFYFFRTVKSKTLQFLIFGAILIAVYNVLLSNTRGILLTFGVLMLLTLITRLIRVRVWFVLLTLGVASVALWYAPLDLRDRLLDFDQYFKQGRDSSFGERLYLMKTSIEVIAESPLFGVGLGNQVDVAERGKLDWRDRSRSAHNDLIATWLEVGLVGVVFVTGFLISFYRRCRFGEDVGRNLTDPKLALLMGAGKLQLFAILTYGIQGEPLTQPLKGFWLTAGIILALTESMIENGSLYSRVKLRVPKFRLDALRGK
jgi:hypothetical protein